MDEAQKKIAMSWINNNYIDNELLQNIISENSNTTQQTVAKYTKEYNSKYSKNLTSPMTKNTLNYIYYLYKEYPNTFYGFGMNIANDIVYIYKPQINLHKLKEKIKKDNFSLLKEKRKLNIENQILRKEVKAFSRPDATFATNNNSSQKDDAN